ncbi:fibronectin type III domain-containing protein [Candidatus Uhrbacteria bacterium]|nr:fibronectin type III domain-containing protein [Candidatus Uhrbacteria bacterium]
MKYTILLIVLLAMAGAGYAWWSATPRIDSTGKIHASLYEGASDSWDPQMQVLPFERAPSTTLTLRWQPPQETYNHFVVTISTVDGTAVRKESGEHDRLSLDPDGLEPDTEYIFALQACLDPRCQAWLIGQDEYRGTTETTTETTIDNSLDNL